MSPALPSSVSRRSYFALRLGLVAAVLATLVFVNRHYFFQEEVYDDGDQAANSLSILRAEHGEELYGNYSRWGFRHPGPAVFYGEGAAELTLYRWLHLTPTPYNAQVLFITLLMTSLLAASLSVAARWMRSGVFLTLALTFAALHLTAANPVSLLMSNWPPFVIPMALLALLVMTASVAAGDGEDLPLLTFAGCLLLHMHVAQPLFVGPMFTLAYAGLIWFCYQRRRSAGNVAPVITASPDNDAVLTASASSARPWRAYRAAHGWSLLIAGLFALPLLVDLGYGKLSNFSLILEHLRTHRGERHPYLASLDYLLRFGVYQPSLPGAPVLLAAPAATASEIGHFITRHLQILLLWVAALLSPLLALLARLRLRNKLLSTGDMLSPALPTGRWRFLGALWVTWAASLGLTLFWAHIQDGPMYYFNAWFDYSIWFVLALLAAGALADAFDVVARGAMRPWLWRGGAVVLCVALAAFVIFRNSQRYRLRSDERIRAYTQTVLSVLDHEAADTPRTKLLLFPDGALAFAMSLAETVTRADRPVYVLPYWDFVFGHNHVLKNWQEYATRMMAGDASFDVWRLVPTSLVEDGQPRSDSLGPYTLVRGGLPVDPTASFAINCAGPNPNSLGFVGKGWSAPTDGEPAWTDEKTAWLQFQARPVPAGVNVEMTFDYRPFLVPGKCDSQRLTLSYNGLDLGTLRATDGSGLPNRVIIPGEFWNKNPSALIVMELPDAMSPKEATGSEDVRTLAFLIRSVKFTTIPANVPATAPTPKPDQPSSETAR